MFIGMIFFLLAAVVGGFFNIIEGDFARYLDSVGYVVILFGISLIAFGFSSNTSPDTE
jgi:hypothetical protein